MRIPNSEHESHGWQIAEIAPDFRLEDAWALPAYGSADDFGEFVDVMSSLDPAHGPSRATRLLFSIRFRIGGWFGWDEPGEQLPIPDKTESTLKERLPEELRGTAPDVKFSTEGFLPLYRTENEWAAEISNRTVHGVLQVGWVDQGGGRYRAEMGIYVKPRGRFGGAYMAAIAPFRHLIVYPTLMREIEYAWGRRRAAAP